MNFEEIYQQLEALKIGFFCLFVFVIGLAFLFEHYLLQILKRLDETLEEQKDKPNKTEVQKAYNKAMKDKR